jgi:hypothetical protein
MLECVESNFGCDSDEHMPSLRSHTRRLAEENLAAVAAARLAIAAIQLILGRALQGRALLAQEPTSRVIVTTLLGTGLNKDQTSICLNGTRRSVFPREAS